MEKDRTPNWSQAEKTMAIGLINDNSQTLFAKFKGSSCGANVKAQKWKQIADELNSCGVTECYRSVDNIKRMYSNVKQRAKDKEHQKKKTGGGPPVTLNESEEKVVEGLRGKPQLGGVEGGLDTSIAVTDCSQDQGAEASVDKQQPAEGTTSQEKSTLVDKNDNETNTTCMRLNSRLFQGKKRKKPDNQELLELEFKRAQAETSLYEQRIQQEHELFLLDKEIKLQELQRKKKIFELQEQLLKQNLEKAFEQGLLSINDMEM